MELDETISSKHHVAVMHTDEYPEFTDEEIELINKLLEEIKRRN